MNRFWERVMLALVVCVPVPALALSGLNVPLPSVVERVAAALVPFASAPTIEGGATLASGRIVHSAKQEARVARSISGTRPAATLRVTRRVTTPRLSAAASRSAPPTIATHASPLSGPSSTLVEDTTTTAAVSPPTDSSTPAPAATAPAPAQEEKPKETRPTEPTPVRPHPVDDVDVMPEPEPEVKPPPPVEPVVPVEPKPEPEPPEPKPKPEPKPAPQPEPEPPVHPEPPKRDPRNDNPRETVGGVS